MEEGDVEEPATFLCACLAPGVATTLMTLAFLRGFLNRITGLPGDRLRRQPKKQKRKPTATLPLG